MKVKCTTLFDITQTNISGRRNLLDDSTSEFGKQRKQQGNFETIQQIISLRSQPENITVPEILDCPPKILGIKYNLTKAKVWSFMFTINHSSIFVDDSGELGLLKKDCANVPMITGLDEFLKLSPVLEIDGDYKNIHFEVVENAT